jgi:hypothetical protein
VEPRIFLYLNPVALDLDPHSKMTPVFRPAYFEYADPELEEEKTASKKIWGKPDVRPVYKNIPILEAIKVV